MCIDVEEICESIRPLFRGFSYISAFIYYQTTDKVHSIFVLLVRAALTYSGSQSQSIYPIFWYDTPKY